jgi:hypothetical protein
MGLPLAPIQHHALHYTAWHAYDVSLEQVVAYL